MGIAIAVRDAAAAAEFYRDAFGAEEVARYLVEQHSPSVGPVKGVTVRIGEAVINVSTANPRTTETMNKWGAKTPEMLAGFSTVMTLYVDDVEAALARALRAGALQRGPVEDVATGDRATIVEDPFGHPWALVVEKEQVSVEEHNRRWDAVVRPELRGRGPQLMLHST
jgi:PhnB protein